MGGQVKHILFYVLPQNLSPICLVVDLSFFVKPGSRQSRDTSSQARWQAWREKQEKRLRVGNKLPQLKAVVQISNIPFCSCANARRRFYFYTWIQSYCRCVTSNMFTVIMTSWGGSEEINGVRGNLLLTVENYVCPLCELVFFVQFSINFSHCAGLYCLLNRTKAEIWQKTN